MTNRGIYRNTDGDFHKPNWAKCPDKVDWHYYISCELRLLWDTFSLTQQEALYNNASKLATDELAHHYRFG